MSNDTRQNQKDPAGGKLRFSIVYKLNAQLFFHLLGIFLALDILLCIGAAVATVTYAERTAAKAMEVVNTSGIPEGSGRIWLGVGGFSIERETDHADGFKIPSVIRNLFFDKSIPGSRYLTLPPATGETFVNRLNGLTYRAVLSEEEEPLVFTLSLEQVVRLWKLIFIGLWIIELLMLIKNLFWGARTARSTLRPLAELAETARSLNTASGGAFTPEEMKRLAGKIDGINASRLDTRISLDSTQDELKNLALAINGMLDRINESYRAQVRFVSDASHELRTPISVIQGYANLLDRWGKNDEKVLQESIGAIKEEAANMKGLVEQLLFLARGDNNTMTLQMEDFDLSELAQEVLRETKMIDGGHVYESRFQPVRIYADEALVKQAMRILIDNAIKYTPAGGRISIFVLAQDGYASLTVQDEGIGIPPDAVPKVFDRFYRADESRARATGGTGLGLSIAKWIAERHGGHMEVLSREDIGTRIGIRIPEARANEKPDETPAGEQTGDTGQST